MAQFDPLNPTREEYSSDQRRVAALERRIQSLESAAKTGGQQGGGGPRLYVPPAGTTGGTGGGAGTDPALSQEVINARTRDAVGAFTLTTYSNLKAHLAAIWLFLTTVLVKTNNLSDLSNVATARNNLGLGTAAVKDVPAAGNASATQVVLGNDTRLPAVGTDKQTIRNSAGAWVATSNLQNDGTNVAVGGAAPTGGTILEAVKASGIDVIAAIADGGGGVLARRSVDPTASAQRLGGLGFHSSGGGGSVIEGYSEETWSGGARGAGIQFFTTVIATATAIVRAKLSHRGDFSLTPATGGFGLRLANTTSGAVTSPVAGATIFDTGTNTVKVYDGSAWQSVSAGATVPGGFTASFDGGGVVIAAGSKFRVRIPYNGTITKWTLLADVSGSAVIDVWKTTYASAPPTISNTITASAKPTLSSAVKNESSTLTGWTTSVSAGDVLVVNVDSASTITQLFLLIEMTRS